VRCYSSGLIQHCIVLSRHWPAIVSIVLEQIRCSRNRESGLQVQPQCGRCGLSTHCGAAQIPVAYHSRKPRFSSRLAPVSCARLLPRKPSELLLETAQLRHTTSLDICTRLPSAEVIARSRSHSRRAVFYPSSNPEPCPATRHPDFQPFPPPPCLPKLSVSPPSQALPTPFPQSTDARSSLPRSPSPRPSSARSDPTRATAGKMRFRQSMAKHFGDSVRTQIFL